jgi:hypothetical protein
MRWLPAPVLPAGCRTACPGVAIVVAAPLAAAAASSTSRDGFVKMNRQLGNRWAFCFGQGRAAVRQFSVASGPAS